MSDAQSEAAERDEILPLLGKMCAYGWVAFGVDICRKLRKILSTQESQQLVLFTGDVIIGIVKPFFEKEASNGESLERQRQTMLLMRAFGWRLRELQDRNWINGYLVDGGDVDICRESCPLRLRYVERSWLSAFLQLTQAQADAYCVEDEQQ
jgi:hypothetical protein